MNSCEFLTIKEEIKSLKKEIKKTTKKLKKLEYKARKCYYSNLGKDVDNENIDLDDEVLEDYYFNKPVDNEIIDELNKNTDENGFIDLNNPAVEEILITYFKDTFKGTDGNDIDDETAKAVLNNFKELYEEELDND